MFKLRLEIAASLERARCALNSINLKVWNQVPVQNTVCRMECKQSACFSKAQYNPDSEIAAHSVGEFYWGAAKFNLTGKEVRALTRAARGGFCQKQLVPPRRPRP